MPKQHLNLFVCQDCGYRSVKWLGRCPDCGSWNSLVEETAVERVPGNPSRRTTPAKTIEEIDSAPEPRLASGLSEFDRTLGGGLVPGSVVLIGGDPGIGKSTLVLQVLDRLATKGRRVLYLSGEESPQQIKLRAERLSVKSPDLFILSATCVEEIIDEIKRLSPKIIAVDSIQTIYTSDLSSSAGSVGQVRESAARFIDFAKNFSVPLFLVGHVTKEGAIAGPKVLEHLVDTVLYFEGDRGHVYRVLRAVKNRFGSTNEIGVFEMKDSGLAEVSNPSGIFLEERPRDAAGSVVVACVEGTRPLLVEIQALVGASALGTPRRTSLGIDHNRISLLSAVLAKTLRIELGAQDIFIKVAGGLKVEEPAADLGIAAGLLSSFLGKQVPQDLVLFGEVGLAGEVRGVSQPELRLREARKMGFSRCMMSRRNLQGAKDSSGMELTGISSIQDLFRRLFGPPS
ncbi:MAG: DNA repair protein RadA [Desulfatiglandaceae bacterium]